MAVISRPIKPERERRAWSRLNPLLTVGAYGLALLAAAVLIQAAITWSQRKIDDVRYGTPRMVVIDGFVGHNEAQGEPTHIITLNLRGQISVLELPGGDVGKLNVLLGPLMVGRDGAYVVPRPALRDVTGDGHVDLLVALEGETLVFVNRNGAFEPLTPEERASLVGANRGVLE
jgi:hypothetical protein